MNDLDEMQGTWKLVSAIEDRKALPEDKVKQTTIVVKGNTFRFPGLARTPPLGRGRSRLTQRKIQKRWTPPPPRKRSRSASTNWNQAAIRSASLRPANHVPPTSVLSPAVAKSSKSGKDRRRTKPKRGHPSFLIASASLTRVRQPCFFKWTEQRRLFPALPPKLHLRFPRAQI